MAVLVIVSNCHEIGIFNDNTILIGVITVNNVPGQNKTREILKQESFWWYFCNETLTGNVFVFRPQQLNSFSPICVSLNHFYFRKSFNSSTSFCAHITYTHHGKFYLFAILKKYLRSLSHLQKRQAVEPLQLYEICAWHKNFINAWRTN